MVQTAGERGTLRLQQKVFADLLLDFSIALYFSNWNLYNLVREAIFWICHYYYPFDFFLHSCVILAKAKISQVIEAVGTKLHA